MFLLNKTKGNTIFYTHLFILKIMYGHFTFLNYYFKGTSQIIKLVKKKKPQRERTC